MLIVRASRCTVLTLMILALGGCGSGGGGGNGQGGGGVEVAAVRLDAPVLAFQQMSEWCWAATIANLFTFSGHPVRQDEIVSAVYGGIVNMPSGNPAVLSAILNNATLVDDNRVAFSSHLEGLYDAVNGVFGLSNDEIRDSLLQNRPLVLGTSQHAMLLVGMAYVEADGHVTAVEEVQVWDPWPVGGGLRNLNASEMTRADLGGELVYVADAMVASRR